MKTCLGQIACAVLLLALTALPSRASDPAERFLAAGKAYDAGQFPEAGATYREIAAQGLVSPELFFNLGNAEYRAGHRGEAVLSYRRAWMLAPRDPDIAANLHFAQQDGNALAPAPGLGLRWLTRVTLAEWMATGVAAYWLLALALAAQGLTRPAHPWFKRIAATAGLLLLVAGSGALAWRGLMKQPELVALNDQQARFAPLADSTPHFSVPAGSIVRELERKGSWLRVQSGNDVGWLPAASAARVYPWLAKAGA